MRESGPDQKVSGEEKADKKEDLERLLKANDRRGVRTWYEKLIEESTQEKGTWKAM